MNELPPQLKAHYNEVFRKYRTYTKREVLKRVPPGQAEDATQEVFMVLLRKMRAGQYKPDNPRAFLKSTANYVALDHKKRYVRAQRKTAAYRQTSKGPGARAGHVQEQHIECHELLSIISAELECMREREREAFIRVRLEGEDVKDIAASAGVCQATVYNYVSKAQCRIEQAMKRRRARRDDDGT